MSKKHNLIVWCGLIVGFYYYSFFWLITLLKFLIGGNTFTLLTITAVYLALQELWQNKTKILKLNATNLQCKLGHILIGCGVLFFPFSLHKGWKQALVWLVIFIGIVISTWGIKFFRYYLRPTFLIIFSIYPGINVLPGYIWQALTPERIMDQIQAWSVNLVLQAMGYPSNIDRTWVNLPTGSVNIGWGCNGFDLMVLMLMTSLLIGIAYRLKSRQILIIGLLGCVIAFVFNTARITLLAISVAYWDEQSFDFWHSGWGGQIFSLAMFTAFYYLLMQMRLLDLAHKSKLQSIGRDK